MKHGGHQDDAAREAFLSLCREKDSSLNGNNVIKTLETLFVLFPDIIYVKDHRLCYLRSELISAIHEDEELREKMMLTSIERSLKRLGLAVSQTTHAHKQWTFVLKEDDDEKGPEKPPRKRLLSSSRE